MEPDRQVSFLAACERAVDAGMERSAALRRSILMAAFEGRLVPQDPTDEAASVLLERTRIERAAAPKTKAGRVRVKSYARDTRPVPSVGAAVRGARGLAASRSSVALCLWVPSVSSSRNAGRRSTRSSVGTEGGPWRSSARWPGEKSETGSDIDLLVEFEPGSSLFDLMRLEDELATLLGVQVDVVSAGGLKDHDEHIRREGRAAGVSRSDQQRAQDVLDAAAELADIVSTGHDRFLAETVRQRVRSGSWRSSVRRPMR